MKVFNVVLQDEVYEWLDGSDEPCQVNLIGRDGLLIAAAELRWGGKTINEKTA